MKQETFTQQLLTRTEVQQAVRLSCSAIYRLMRAGKFPLPIRIGENAVRWKTSEINNYLETRPRATGDIKRIPEASAIQDEQAVNQAHMIVERLRL